MNPLLKTIAYPFSILYGSVVSVRNLLFDLHILPSRRLPFWVISVGNLSAGGTGKSPHVEYIARILAKNKSLDTPFDKIGVLSRGYGRASKSFLLVNNTSNAKEVGDEPLQLKRKLKDLNVAVDVNRLNGIKMLLMSNPQIRMILLDDAFQHRYVKPTISVLLTNYHAPFYNDMILPAGMLREPRRGYKRAQFIIVTNTPATITDIEKKSILKNINPKAKQKVFFSSIVYEGLQAVFKSDAPAPVIDKTYSVLLLTGIANTHSIYNHLIETARDVVHIPFADHHVFKPADVTKAAKAFNAITNPNKVIITTEKDAMRLQLGDLQKEFGTAPVSYLPIRVKVHEEEAFETALIDTLQATRKK